MEPKEIKAQPDSNKNNEITPIVLFPTSPQKLAIMSIVTFGIYEIYWFYRNWKFLKETYNLNISPFARAWFSIFFCHSLFKNIKKHAEAQGIKEIYKPGRLTFAYILMFVTHRAPDPAWLIAAFTFIPLLTVQKVINRFNQNQLKQVINSKFSGWNIFAVVLGAIWWGIIIFGMIFPE